MMLAFALSACASSGPYGHSPAYAPLGDEETAAAGSKEYDPVMAKRSRRQVERRRRQPLQGSCSRAAQAPAETPTRSSSVRTLEPRNLCDSSDEDTCRVTVSDHEHAVVHVPLALDRGRRPVASTASDPRSLVRVDRHAHRRGGSLGRRAGPPRHVLSPLATRLLRQRPPTAASCGSDRPPSNEKCSRERRPFSARWRAPREDFR